MNIHQASYLVSIYLILLFILASPFLCVEVRLKVTTGIQFMGFVTTCMKQMPFR